MNSRTVTDLSPEELENYITGINEKPFRVDQIASWVYRKGVSDYSEMTNLPEALRHRMESELPLRESLSLYDRKVSTDGTEKFLFQLQDGNRIESVLIPDSGRLTLCMSSQVGCALGCTFCLTGTVGRIRNLGTSEIVEQLMKVNSMNSRPVTNIVFMGMGEPLDNLDNLVRSIRIITDPRFIGMSSRRITVSTSGLVPRIKELGGMLTVNLSVSLNAPNDSIRDEIMPINRRYRISELLDSVRDFPFPKRKMLTFEYVLLKGVNDSRDDARQLASLLSSLKCKVNLIPFNEAEPLPYKSPEMEQVYRFREILSSSGINTRIRKNRGRDILGACGQLAASYPSATRRQRASVN